MANMCCSAECQTANCAWSSLLLSNAKFIIMHKCSPSPTSPISLPTSRWLAREFIYKSASLSAADWDGERKIMENNLELRWDVLLWVTIALLEMQYRSTTRVINAWAIRVNTFLSHFRLATSGVSCRGRISSMPRERGNQVNLCNTTPATRL